jgi:hypothetical protein
MQDGRSKRPHSKRCAERMLEALATTERGRARIQAGRQRINAEVIRRNGDAPAPDPAPEAPEQAEAPEQLEVEPMVEDAMDLPGDATPTMAADASAQDVVMGRLQIDRDEGAGGMLLKMAATGPGGVDIVEIYSPKRVTAVGEEIGLRPGLSMDLLTGWDFDKQSDRKAAIKYVKEVKPWLVIGSPMCTMFSQLMNLNWNKSKERDDKMRDMLGRAIRHVEFMIVIYRMQIDGGAEHIEEECRVTIVARI